MSYFYIGPISFINNTINSSVSNVASIANIGHLIIKNNTFYNMELLVNGKVQQLEIEHNSFIYSLFTGAYLISLTSGGYNAQITGLAGLPVYTRINDNIFEDRTSGYSPPSYVILVYDPGITSTLNVERNQFIFGQYPYAIDLQGSSATVALTTIFRGNLMGYQMRLGTKSTATTSHVIYQNNKTLAGTDFIGAAPTDATQYYSVGSIVYSNNPASDDFIGWVCTVEGAPGTWKTFGAVTP